MTVEYLIKRLLFFVMVVWAAASINFVLPRLSGQDPVRQRLYQEVTQGRSVEAGIEEMIDEYNRKFGLDKPLWEQYLTYLGDLARFDLGQSIVSYPRPVSAIIADSALWSLGLLGVATIIAFGIGTLLGALLGWPRSPRWLHYLAMPIVALAAIPYYLVGLMLLFVFAYVFGWFPGFGGYTTGNIPKWAWWFARDVIAHSLLPALSIILSALGGWALGMRAMMVTIQGEDYMTMAEAKGLKGRNIFLHYAVRNALLPQTTGLALSTGHLLAGSVLVETVFAYPGIGYTLYTAIRNVDFPVIQGIVFMIILSLALAMLVVDLMLPLLDPRIAYTRD